MIDLCRETGGRILTRNGTARNVRCKPSHHDMDLQSINNMVSALWQL